MPAFRARLLSNMTERVPYACYLVDEDDAPIVWMLLL
jgi:hypothetical protein